MAYEGRASSATVAPASTAKDGIFSAHACSVQASIWSYARQASVLLCFTLRQERNDMSSAQGRQSHWYTVAAAAAWLAGCNGQRCQAVPRAAVLHRWLPEYHRQHATCIRIAHYYLTDDFTVTVTANGGQSRGPLRCVRSRSGQYTLFVAAHWTTSV